MDRRSEQKEVYRYYIIHGVMMYGEGWRPGVCVLRGGKEGEGKEGGGVRA